MLKPFHILLFLWVVMAVACQNNAAMQIDSSFHISGSSMEPTLTNGNILGIDEQAYTNTLPQRGDIIVFYLPNSDVLLVKRIIGLPNETIEIVDGDVLINGASIVESYLDSEARYTGQWQLGKDEYFVLSDNRNNGSDSHSWGALPSENIIGKATVFCSSMAQLSCTTEIEPIDYSQ
jgi:signal peptidase I